MNPKSLLTTLFLSTLFFSTLNAQEYWPIETLRTDIIGAWSRAGDFDNDGDGDILIQAGDSIYWHENLMPGWEPHLIDPTFFDSDFAMVDVQDLNGDGNLDVLKAPASGPGPYELTWNENISDGNSWEKHTILSTPNYLGLMEDSYGDLDGDGDLDIVIPEYSYGAGSLYWIENIDNTGEYVKHVLKFGDHGYSTLADMDGDGDIDIVSATNEVFWLENLLPDSTWTKHEIVAPGNSYHSAGLCRDLNGDGMMDFISNPYTNGVGKIAFHANPGWGETDIINSPTVILGKVGDIDNDGDTDITYGGHGFGGPSQALGWAENQDNGSSWVLHDVIAPTTAQMFCSGLADFDGDGDLDIASLDFNTSTGLGSVFWAANPLISTGTSSINTYRPSVSISPNPASNNVAISIQTEQAEVFEVEIFDLNGKLLKSFESENNTTNEIGIETWSSGVYMVKVFNQKGMAVQKIVKQ